MKIYVLLLLSMFGISYKSSSQIFQWENEKDGKITLAEFTKNEIIIQFKNPKPIEVTISFVPEKKQMLPVNGEISYQVNSNKLNVGKNEVSFPTGFEIQSELSITADNKSLVFPIKKSEDGVKGREKVTKIPVFFPPNDMLSVVNSCLECNQTSELDIHYDISCNKITFPVVKKKNGYSLKMLPVDKLIRIVPINYNPYLDSISVSVQFDDKNIEDKALFAGFFAPQQAQSKASENAKKDGDAEHESATPEQDKELSKDLESLNNELIEFIGNVSSLPSIDIVKLENITSELLKSINRKFGMTITNGSDFEKKYIEKFNPVDEQVKILLKNIASNLNKILRFNRSYILPVQIENADQSIFTFHSYKKGQKVGEFKYSFFNKGGFKIDFSSGLFATGLIDKKYAFSGSRFKIDTTHSYIPVWDKDNNVTVMKDSITGYTTRSERQIVKGGGENFNIGLGVLLHAYTRWGKRINGGISIGGIIDNQSTIKYTGGGSLLLGREQRLIITGGIALGKINKLADGLIESEWITPGTSQTSPATELKWSSSWFVGVTYNLGTLVNR